LKKFKKHCRKKLFQQSVNTDNRIKPDYIGGKLIPALPICFFNGTDDCVIGLRWQVPSGEKTFTTLEVNNAK